MANAQKAWERWWARNKETPVPYGTFDKMMQKLFTEGFTEGYKQGMEDGIQQGHSDYSNQYPRW